MVFFSTGTYANVTGLSECLVCPAGFECEEGSTFPVPCPQGYFCHIGNDPSFKGIKQKCPSGTFGATQGLTIEEQCSKCTGGKYCEVTGLKAVSGTCDAGYYCRERSSSKQPKEDSLKRFGPCPPGGFYCVQGSISPTPCPPGRYAPGNKFMLSAESDCDLCPAGKYCAAGNQINASGLCSAGYYCNKGSPDMAPTNITYGGICPPGTYCPAGTRAPIPCAAGTYNNMSGQGSCTGCPKGFYCPANSTYPLDCPSGYWCEAGATVFDTNACPAGTFNSLPRRYLRSHCVDCTPGYYCEMQGKRMLRIFDTNFFATIFELFETIL